VIPTRGVSLPYLHSVWNAIDRQTCRRRHTRGAKLEFSSPDQNAPTADGQVRNHQRTTFHLLFGSVERPAATKRFAPLLQNCNAATALSLLLLFSFPIVSLFSIAIHSSLLILQHDRVSVLRFGPLCPDWTYLDNRLSICPGQVRSSTRMNHPFWHGRCLSDAQSNPLAD
jgi:hypothetical protein